MTNQQRINNIMTMISMLGKNPSVNIDPLIAEAISLNGGNKQLVTKVLNGRRVDG